MSSLIKRFARKDRLRVPRVRGQRKQTFADSRAGAKLDDRMIGKAGKP